MSLSLCSASDFCLFKSLISSSLARAPFLVHRLALSVAKTTKETMNVPRIVLSAITAYRNCVQSHVLGACDCNDTADVEGASTYPVVTAALSALTVGELGTLTTANVLRMEAAIASATTFVLTIEMV